MDEPTNKEMTTLKRAFSIYSVTPSDVKTPYFMNVMQVSKFLEDLSSYNPILKNIDDELIKAFFSLIDVNCDGKIFFDEFVAWWRGEISCRERFETFKPDKRELLRKAWRIFHRFSIGNVVPYRKFEAMMGYLNVPYASIDFDLLDLNNDGVLSFSEFCDWLKWF